MCAVERAAIRRESLSEPRFLFAIALYRPAQIALSVDSTHTKNPEISQPTMPVFQDTITAYTVNALASSCNWVSARRWEDIQRHLILGWNFVEPLKCGKTVGSG